MTPITTEVCEVCGGGGGGSSLIVRLMERSGPKVVCGDDSSLIVRRSNALNKSSRLYKTGRPYHVPGFVKFTAEVVVHLDSPKIKI